VGIDFKSLSLNIQKDNRVKNTLPQYLSSLSDSEDEIKESASGGTSQTTESQVPFGGLIPNSARPKITHRGRHFAYAFVVVCLGLIGALIYFLRQPSPIFCDFQEHTPGEPECTPCPRHATCRNGKAKCWDNYELH